MKIDEPKNCHDIEKNSDCVETFFDACLILREKAELVISGQG